MFIGNNAPLRFKCGSQFLNGVKYSMIIVRYINNSFFTVCALYINKLTITML